MVSESLYEPVALQPTTRKQYPVPHFLVDTWPWSWRFHLEPVTCVCSSTYFHRIEAKYFRAPLAVHGRGSCVPLGLSDEGQRQLDTPEMES